MGALPAPATAGRSQEGFAERQRRNEETNASDFSDCLQICDKCEILLKDSELWPLLGFSSRTGGQRFFSALESLRNDLAHANDILRGRWPELADWATQGGGPSHPLGGLSAKRSSFNHHPLNYCGQPCAPYLNLKNRLVFSMLDAA
jgi:hypothetical protein